MQLRIALVTLCLLGCETSSGKSVPDADPNAPPCTGDVYDNCINNAQCTGGMCHLFSGEFQVCTVTCTAGDNSTCPPSLGGTPKCNNRGICKPALNNMCRPPG